MPATFETEQERNNVYAGSLYTVAPSATPEADTTRDDARVFVDIEGLTPSDWVEVSVDGDVHGTVRSDDEGNAFSSVYFRYQLAAGDHVVRFEDSNGRFVEKVITVNSQVPPLTGRVLTGATHRHGGFRGAQRAGPQRPRLGDRRWKPRHVLALEVVRPG